jgi:hypothetical protein
MGDSPETLDFLPRGRVFLQHLLDWWGYVNAVLQRLADSLNTATLLNAALGDSLDEPLLTIHRVLALLQERRCWPSLLRMLLLLAVARLL